MDSPVLLDTHAWVWLIEGTEGLDPRAVAAMERTGDESVLRLGAISLWEVAMLEAKGRLRFDIACLDWIEQALGLPGLSLIPLTPSICVNSANLPGELDGDPADRLIVATARALGATLVTRDGRILRYGAEGHVRSLPL